MQILADNLNIIHLDLSSNDITPRGADIIFTTLLNQHSIISLDLSSKEGINRNRLSHEGMRLLERVLKENLLLEYLYLAGNSVKNEGLKSILLGLAENKTLNTLHLSNNEITFTGIKYFSKLFI
jgi:Ran GTPase-activating protein (RanGAP) involved in mRNA processing and transport